LDPFSPNWSWRVPISSRPPSLARSFAPPGYCPSIRGIWRLLHDERPHFLTVGWIGRHTPPGADVDGRDAAVIDIAQDLLLRELHDRGVLDTLAFKGGTSLRKLYAGNQGRFSLSDDPDTVLLNLISEIDGLAVGPFAYGVTERRGKWWLTMRTEFATVDSALSSKLDVSRLNRTTTARDLYDLASLADLNTTIQAHYSFLRNLDPAERQLAPAREQDRHLTLRLLSELPDGRLASLGLH
jgi:hypothetical protein